jgi:hypothetical protein
MSFSELVIDVPFLMTKGLLLGYRAGADLEFDYFFHHKSGIRRESIGEMVRELLHLDCMTHICIPDDQVQGFRKGLAKVSETIPVHVRSIRPIESAFFNFSFHIYNKRLGEICKSIFKNVEKGVEIDQKQPSEVYTPTTVGVHEYAPMHSYTYDGQGTVHGDFYNVVKLFREIKKSKVAEWVHCSDIKLKIRDG